MKYLLIFSIFLTWWHLVATAYCPETIIKEKFLPITGIKAIWVPTKGISTYMPSISKIYSYKITDKHIKYDVINKCCTGFSMNSFGECEPLCETRRCGKFEKCVEPNVCHCMRGYKEASDSVNATCIPICIERCGIYAHCVAPNLCACDEAYVSNSSDTTGVVECKRRCRAGVLWDPITLTCVERAEANVTVIAAEMDLFMPDLEVKQVESIEGGGDGQLEAFISAKNSAITTNSTEIPESKACDRFTLIHLLIALGVTMFLLTFAAVALYILKRRQGNNSNVILEGKNYLPGECFIDRSQILVY